MRKLVVLASFAVASLFLPALAQAQLASDDFSDGIITDWTTYGSCWSESGGVFHCSTTPPNTPIAAIRADGGDWTDYAVEADVKVLGNYQPSTTGLVFRFESEYPIGNYCDCSFYQYQGSFLRLYCLGGPHVQTPVSIALNTWYRLRATVAASRATCEVVGTPGTLLSASFSGIPASGSAGFRSTHLATDFDNFTVLGQMGASEPRIVFSRGSIPGGRPWIADLDGSNAAELADVSLASYPRIANGTVVFMSEDYQGLGPAIYRMDATPGAPVTKVPNTDGIRTPNGLNYDAIDLSPDGTRIVWAAPEPGDFYQNHNVYVMDVDGTDKVRVLRDTSKHYLTMNWGELDRIILIRSNVGNAFSQREYAMRPDGTNFVLAIADFAQNLHMGGPDGRGVMNWTQPYPQPLATVDSAFGDFQYVPGVPSGYRFLSWHPTENRIFGEKLGKIYSIDGDTGVETLILEFPGDNLLTGDVGGAFPTDQPPVADAGQNQIVSAGPACTADVQLDGSGSFDPEGELLEYLWTWSGPSFSVESPLVTLPPGVEEFTITVTDAADQEDSDAVLVEVLDDTAPSATSSAAPDELWPPNHRWVDVELAYSTADNCSAVSCSVTSISSNEPPTGPGADWEIVDADTVHLRAARSGSGSGRVYTITSTCTDSAGNSTEALSYVPVPAGAVVLYATQDTFLRHGAPDTNEGGNDQLRIQSSGKNRVLVAFDLSEVEPAYVSSATLVLTISENADNWGPTGRTVSAHRVQVPWTEGNGWTVGGNDRGDGPGATWTCPTDADISDQSPDCPGSEWSGGTFDPATGPTAVHFNGMSGDVSFDVTADLAAGAANGWLVSKDVEGQSGKVHYHSREGAAVIDPDLAPRLVLHYD